MFFFFCFDSGDRLLPLSADNDDSPFLTLQEAEDMSKQKLLSAHGNREVAATDNPTWKANDDESVAVAVAVANEQSQISNNDTLDDNTAAAAAVPNTIEKAVYIGHKIPEDFLKKAGLLNADSDDGNEIRPLYNMNADGTLPGEYRLKKKKNKTKQYRVLDNSFHSFDFSKIHQMKYLKH